MSYEIRFEPKAAERIDELPLSLLDEVEAAFRRLAADPAGESVSGAFPFRADRRLFHFAVTDFDDGRWDFTAHFRFTPDEEAILVIALVVMPPS